MELLEKVKTALRVSTDKFDEAELIPIIEACKRDLKLAGVVKIEDSDHLVVRSAVLYAKGNFGYDDDKGRFQQAYEKLRDSMALSGLYGGDEDA